MKKIRNEYRCLTEGKSDMVDLNGVYNGIRRTDGQTGENKWVVNKGDIPIFEELGILPDNDRVFIGKISGSLYLVQMFDNPRVVCKIKSYQPYKSDEFMWVSGEAAPRYMNPVLNKSGQFLVNLRLGESVQCPEPPLEKDMGKRYEIDGEMTIKWTGRNFETEREKQKSEEVTNERRNIDDMRKDKLEEYLEEHLKDEVELDVKGAKQVQNMSEVNKSETPEPMAKVFYQLGDGDYPEDPEGDFKPPDKDEFVNFAYSKFKSMSDDDAFREENREAWYKRFEKTWASLLRDVHFSYMMYQEQDETAAFDDVEFDLDRDVEEGVDFVVEKDGTEYHINLFISSAQSKKFRARKEKYRKPDSDAVGIEVPMHFGGPKKELETKGDDMWLFTEKHVDAIKDMVLGDKDKVVDNDTGATLSKKIGDSY